MKEEDGKTQVGCQGLSQVVWAPSYALVLRKSCSTTLETDKAQRPTHRLWHFQSYFCVCNLKISALAFPACFGAEVASIIQQEWLQACADRQLTWNLLSQRDFTGSLFRAFVCCTGPRLPAPSLVLKSWSTTTNGPQPSSSHCESLGRCTWCLFFSQHCSVWTRPMGFNWVSSLSCAPPTVMRGRVRLTVI